MNPTQSFADDPVMKIPFQIQGIMSGFTVRMPTDAELADKGEDMTTHINMTSTSDWEPAVVDFAATRSCSGCLHQQ